MNTADFLKAWHIAVEANDINLIGALVAEDARISSPAYWTPKGPKPYVMTILGGVVAGFEDFHYTKEWVDGKEIIFEFEARIDDVKLRGIDRISLNNDGLLEHIEVMIRPINALFKAAEFIKTEFEEAS